MAAWRWRGLLFTAFSVVSAPLQTWKLALPLISPHQQPAPYLCSTEEVSLRGDSSQVPLQHTTRSGFVSDHRLHWGSTLILPLAESLPRERGQHIHTQFSCQVVKQELFPGN